MFFFFNFSVIKNVLNYFHINNDVREKSIVRNINFSLQEWKYVCFQICWIKENIFQENKILDKPFL